MFVDKFIKNASKVTPKQLVLTGVFLMALAGSVGLGLANRMNVNAATQRDCDTNSIDHENRNGGCGAATPAELIQDIKDNKPADLSMIYDHFGLTPGKYDKFVREAKPGTLYRDGRIEVDGKTVMTDAWTMGREKFNAQREAYTIKNNTYYHSAPSSSFGDNTKSLPVMVLFADNGAVDIAVINACGNPITRGNKITPKAACEAILASQPDVAKKPNTWNFTAKAAFSNGATVSRVVYSFSDDNTTVTKNSLTDVVEHTFKKDGKVTVTVYAKTPGGKEIQATHVINCEKQIKYTKPMFVCVNLVAATINQQERSFRFTVKVSMDKTTTLKHADFTENGQTTTGVTTKDKDGNIYKDYAFNDDKSHTVKATVYFSTSEGVKSTTCEASVTPKKQPVCVVPGKEHLPPNHPDCGYCKPGVPIGSEECKPGEVLGETLPNTGPTETALFGLAAGVGMAGFAGHKLYLRRKIDR